jgi:hypothetical protein
MLGDDCGACGHPSISRHRKMAKELITYLQELESVQNKNKMNYE